MEFDAEDAIDKEKNNQQAPSDPIFVAESPMKKGTYVYTIVTSLVGDTKVMAANDPSVRRQIQEENKSHEGGEIEGLGTFKIQQKPDGFYCKKCGNRFNAAGSLKLHMRACLREPHGQHPMEERKCRICHKVFHSVWYVKQHMIHHTSVERLHRCSYCYRKFSDTDKYRSHVDGHERQIRLEREAAEYGGHKKVVVKEFNCSFCSKMFKVVFDVGQVKRRYACDDCRMTYMEREAEKQQKSTSPSKRQMFKCDRCEREFVFEGFLQRHVGVCDGNKKRKGPKQR